MFRHTGSIYALTVLAALIIAYWNPHPVIVATSVPWLVEIEPISAFQMFTHRASRATALNLIGMLAITALGTGSVIGNHQRINALPNSHARFRSRRRTM